MPEPAGGDSDHEDDLLEQAPTRATMLSTISASSRRNVGSLRNLMNQQLSVKSLISQMSVNPLNAVITPSVEFEDRAWRVAKFDYLFAFIFAVGLLLHFSLGGMIMHKRNIFTNSTGLYVTADAAQALSECEANLFALTNASSVRRRELATALSTTDAINECSSLWCVLDRSDYLTVTTMTVAPIFGALWIFFLYKFPLASAWAAALWNPVLYVSVAVALLANTEGTTILACLFLATALVLLMVLFFTQEPVRATGEHLRIATSVLWHNAYVFRAVYIQLVVLCFFLAWHWAVAMRTSEVVEFKVESACEPTTPRYITASNTSMFFFMIWFVSYCKTSKLVIISMCIGSWFLQQTHVPPRPDLVALRTSVTSSLGTIAGGSVVTEFVDYLIERSGSRFWWLDPLGYVVRPLNYLFSRCFTPFTRFSVIAHAFTGEGFGPSAYRSTKLLQRNFHKAYVADRILISAVRTGSNALSIMLGLLAWIRIDKANGWDSLSNSSDSGGVFGGIGGLLLFVVLATYLTRRPLLGLLLIAVVNDSSLAWLSGSVLIFAPMAGVYVACVSSLIINFQGDFVLNTIDTIFMCYAIYNDSGIDVPLTDSREDAHDYADSMPAAKIETKRRATALAASRLYHGMGSAGDDDEDEVSQASSFRH